MSMLSALILATLLQTADDRLHDDNVQVREKAAQELLDEGFDALQRLRKALKKEKDKGRQTRIRELIKDMTRSDLERHEYTVERGKDLEITVERGDRFGIMRPKDTFYNSARNLKGGIRWPQSWKSGEMFVADLQGKASVDLIYYDTTDGKKKIPITSTITVTVTARRAGSVREFSPTRSGQKTVDVGDVFRIRNPARSVVDVSSPDEKLRVEHIERSEDGTRILWVTFRALQSGRARLEWKHAPKGGQKWTTKTLVLVAAWKQTKNFRARLSAASLFRKHGQEDVNAFLTVQITNGSAAKRKIKLVSATLVTEDERIKIDPDKIVNLAAGSEQAITVNRNFALEETTAKEGRLDVIVEDDEGVKTTVSTGIIPISRPD